MLFVLSYVVILSEDAPKGRASESKDVRFLKLQFLRVLRASVVNYFFANFGAACTKVEPISAGVLAT